MKIGVVGSGNVGSALAGNWAKKNHDVQVGVRDPESEKAVTFRSTYPEIPVLTIEEVASWAEVLVVSTPAAVAVDLCGSFGDCSGKLIIDATNSVFSKPEGYNTAFEVFREKLSGAAIVKAFNCAGFETMADPNFGSTAADMFVAGDDLDAKKQVARLAEDCGFDECYDFGGDDKVELLEQMALAWINLAIMQGQGRKIAFKMLKR